jgi:hypothetical protein
LLPLRFGKLSKIRFQFVLRSESAHRFLSGSLGTGGVADRRPSAGGQRRNHDQNGDGGNEKRTGGKR